MCLSVLGGQGMHALGGRACMLWGGGHAYMQHGARSGGGEGGESSKVLRRQWSSIWCSQWWHSQPETNTPYDQHLSTSPLAVACANTDVLRCLSRVMGLLPFYHCYYYYYYLSD